MSYVEDVLLLLSVDHIWYYVEISVISLLLNKDDETQKNYMSISLSIYPLPAPIIGS